MDVKSFAVKFVLVGLAILAAAILIVLVRRSRETIGERLMSCRSVKLPELLPSGGIGWSRQRYPDQYGEENRIETRLEPVEGVGSAGFRQQQRFLDVAGRAFSRDFSSRFSYEPGAEWSPVVRLSYLKRAETFVGHISATGLKPDFAYQVKLRGMFEDRDAFERIGRLGRWRLPGGGTNFTDEDYADYPDKEEVRSYLLFDFFITDARGNVEHDLYLDSSLHVLYNATWQGGPRREDTRPVVVKPGRPDSWLYARPLSQVESQEIYAESESDSPSGNDRPHVGRAFLPPGKYRAHVALTEESFHGFGDAGYWATVMQAPVEFDVVDRPRPPAGQWGRLEPIMELSLAAAEMSGIVASELREGLLTGKAISEEASVIFSENLELAPAERYVLRVDLKVQDPHLGWVIVDNGEGWDEGPRYYLESSDCEKWRTFEVEITHAVAGQDASILIGPRDGEGRIGVRNPVVCRASSGRTE